MVNLVRKTLLLLPVVVILPFAGEGQTGTRNRYNQSPAYAGIEVGSKGVKLSVIEMGPDARSKGAFTILKDSSVNTDFISFTPASFSATLKGFAGLYQTAKRDLQIPSERIFTVISSGVKMQAEKDRREADIRALIDSFRLLINESSWQVNVVDVVDEARLSHLGIVPDSRRYTTFLLDIGSGNTKGGFFPFDNTRDFRLFQLNWGTKSTANAAEKRIEGENTLDNYSRQLARVLSAIENSELIYAVNASGAYPMSDNIAFSGGIAWAVATLSRPELISSSIVTLTYEDLRKFTEKLEHSFKELSPEALAAQVKDPNDKKMVRAEAGRVLKVFDQRALMAGAGLLLRIMRQFESVYSSKNYFLVKNGQVGWISAYVEETVNRK